MPNRVLRDWTASEKMDRLSQGAEVFFTRLIMKADDYGLYYGNAKLLNSALFPLREYENSQVLKWLNECVTAKVIHKYTVDGKDYIQIIGFDQRLRLMKSKFPAPTKFEEFHEPSNDSQMTVKCPPETKRNETETEVETETETSTLRATLPDIFFGEDVQAAWLEWEQYRKEKRQKLTPSTAKKQMQFLAGRAGPEAVAIINQSITNGWTGLFELKNKSNGGYSTKREQNASELKQALANSIMQEFGNGQVQGGG